MILACDVGGTKTQLGIFSADWGPRRPLFEATFQNAGYEGFEPIVKEFLARVNVPVETACIGVAGPVMNGQSRVTNLPWVISEQDIRDRFSFPRVTVINDLQAVACAISLLKQADLLTLHEGRRVAGGNIAVIAPGTGLGEAFLIWDGTRYQAHASEGGHADFAPNNSLEISMLRVLQEQRGHVSWESVCSGQGIPRIYDFLRDYDSGMESVRLSDHSNRVDDRTPDIVAAALDQHRPCERCVRTLDLFSSMLGAEAGNLALKVLAAGGVYLAGGMTLRILPFLQKGFFMEAFRRKGRMSDLVSSMPVYVILNDTVALIGAAAYGLSFL